MPYSEQSRRLYAEAHKLGDEYYQCYSRSVREKGVMDEECLQTAIEYLARLENLLTHLKSLRKSAEVKKLIGGTESFIEIVKKDLMKFGNKPDQPISH